MNRNLITNNRALSKYVYAIGIIALLVIAAAWALSGSTPASPSGTNTLAVQFDGVAVNWNETVHQPIIWGDVAGSKTYTKNLTVTNLYPTAVRLYLYTTAPPGSHLTWPLNQTVLQANQSSSEYLVLTTEPTVTTGAYTWLLVASNSTTAPTPTPTTSGSPSAEMHNCTVTVQGTGVQQIKVSTVGTTGGIIITQGSFPYNYPFKIGDTIKLEVTVITGYIFNAWEFTDGTPPQTTPTITLTATADFTITAKFLLDAGAP